MERELSRDEFYAALGALSRSMETGFSGLNSRLDKLNGKTERHGEDISALKAVQVREEREARDDEPSQSGRRDGAIGAGVAAGVVGIIELVKVLWK